MGVVCCRDQNKQGLETRKLKKVMSTPGKQTPKQTSIKVIQNSSNLINNVKSGTSTLRKHGAENYQSIKYLGRGTFGDVVLAEDKQNNHQYAMKIIDKRKIKQFNVLQSQKIRKISQHSLFASIRQTFQNQNKIYIVMQYMPRGDIYYYLKKGQGKFTQDIIKMLVAEIIVGIQILHENGIIYRQLKPQNILITNDGHIKLTDYGLSKMIISEANPINTFIGTLEYTAPEALNGQYGKKVDLWAIGVLMFELKFKKNLFATKQSDTNEDIQNNIQKTSIEQALNEKISEISHQFRDVQIKLLQKDPEKRMSLQELKNHPFFKGVVWSDIPQRKNAPPLKHILQTDHIKFRDPTNEKELAHRKIIDNRRINKQYKASLYQFRSSE